jgi:ABC-type nitrate/sulfonate/bicarbonate transport system substrate-binding protein
MSRRLSRRAFLQSSAGFALAAGLTACGSDGSTSSGAAHGGSHTALDYQLSWLASVEFGGSYLAKDRGFYSAEGLDVSFRPGGPNVSIEPVVAAGTALIGITNADYAARAVKSGAPLKVVAAGFQHNPFALLSMAAKPIRTPEAMYGKRIGVPASDAPAFAALLTANKLDASKIKRVPVGFDIAPLVSGDVDGLVSFYWEQPIALKLAGHEPVTFLMADHGLDVFAHAYIVTDDSLEHRRAELLSFLRGEIKGWQAFAKDPMAGVDAVMNNYAKRLGLKRDAQELQAKAEVDLLENESTKAKGLMTMSPEQIAVNVSSFKLLGIEGVGEELFDTSLLDEIFKNGTTV